MECRQAEVFLAVAEELHFGRAAARLHMAQPPVTRIIKQLEAELDATLFERSTRHVALTAQGNALIGPARRVLDAEREGRRAVRAAAEGRAGEVRVGFAGASTHTMIGRLARRVRRERPGITFVLDSQNFAQVLMKRVVDGELEIGLGRWDFVPPSAESRVVAHERLVIALPAAHPLASSPGVHIRQFAHEPFVALRSYQGSVLTDRLERLARGAGFLPEITQLAPDTGTALAMVAAEIGPTLTLSTVAENVLDPHIVFVPVLDETRPVELRMAWRGGEQMSPALAAVLAIAEEELPVLDEATGTAA